MKTAIITALSAVCILQTTPSSSQTMPSSIEGLPLLEQLSYLEEYEMMVWTRNPLPPGGEMRPGAESIDESGYLGFWFFANCYVRYDRQKLRDQQESAQCPVLHPDCNGGCSTVLSRTYSEMDIPLWITNGFCSDGQTNGGQSYTCSIQGMPNECGVCDAPCRTEQLKINDENVPGNDLYLARFWHPGQLDQSIELAHQYQDQTYSAPYSGAYWRFHEQDYKPIWPRTGSYENIESNADYAASYNQFWRGETRSIGIWDTKFTAWFKRGAVGYNHLNWSVPSAPLTTDLYWERYVQLCDWVLGFEMWVCPQPARGTDAYNDIFDIWYDTRYDPWYGDADLTPVEPATWGQIKGTYK